MSEYNENPFKKDTPVRCFSNGTEADIWQSNNCDKCIHNEYESKTEEEAKCKLSFYICLGLIVGTIPLWVAKEIGCDYYNPLYGYVKLYNKCRKRRLESERDLTF